jgi:hypothetical protein
MADPKNDKTLKQTTADTLAATAQAHAASAGAAPAGPPKAQQSNDGRYYPAKFERHPSLIEGLADSLKEGDAIYIAHAASKYFVISAEQAAKGMVLGDKRFPEPANLLEMVEAKTSPAPAE